MSKQEFLEQLRKGLSGLPKMDIEERLTFYSEMIDDRIEEGLSEDQAVVAVGSIDEIIAQIIVDTPISKIAKERIKPKRRLKTWEIILLALGSPIWLSLVIASIAVTLSVYVSLWSVIISLWSVFVSLAACSVSGIITCIFFAITSKCYTGIAMLAAGIVCAGLSIIMFYGCKITTKGIIILTKKIAVWIKNCFIKKEDAS